MTTILVAGASGEVGRCVVRSLTERGARVRVLVHSTPVAGVESVRGDLYRLSFSLKNQAAQPVAVPALELTLTDSQDQPMVRRVLTPRDLGATQDTIPASSDWSGSAALSLELPGNAGRVAGYRLLAFYP